MIPVSQPSCGEEEIAAVVGAMKAGELSGSFGRNIPAFESEFAAFIGSKHGVAVSSGSTALHLAVSAFDFEPGSEVLVSASTNIASALCAYHNGLVTVPVDSEPDSWNLNIDLIEGLITEKTRAIVVVHLFGCPVDMPRIMTIADRHNLAVIEDCAEAHGALIHGKKAGSFGHLACFSFYANKIISTGEGGLITTDDRQLAERCKLLRNLAFGTPRFLHHESGFNFRMTGMQAALGRAQLSKIAVLLEEKRAIARLYNEELRDLSWLTLPSCPTWGENVYWMYAVTVDSSAGADRDQLMAFLKDKGIETRTFFCPMNMQPCLSKRNLLRQTPCPVAERIWRDGLYLPSGYDLPPEQIREVCRALREFGKLHNVG